MQCKNCSKMEIDKKIILRLIQVLEDLKKSLKGINFDSEDSSIEEEIVLIESSTSISSNSRCLTITSILAFSPSSVFSGEVAFSSVVQRRSSRTSNMSAPNFNAFGASLHISSTVLPPSVTHTRGFCIRNTELSGLFNRVERRLEIIASNSAFLSTKY